MTRGRKRADYYSIFRFVLGLKVAKNEVCDDAQWHFCEWRRHSRLPHLKGKETCAYGAKSLLDRGR